jgi:hypothetical protein
VTEKVSGQAWAEEFRQLPALEQMTRDGGSAQGNRISIPRKRRKDLQQSLVVPAGDQALAA